VSIAGDLVEAFLTLGQRGELDELFFGEPTWCCLRTRTFSPLTST